MELRQYWHVLVRRRIALRNTFLIVAVISLLMVAYSYYNSRYLGETQIGVQAQPNPVLNSKGAVIDAQQAANTNTGAIEDALANYAGSEKYFRLVSQELKDKYGVNLDYRTIGSGLKVFEASTGHSIYVEWPSSTQARATDIVAAAGDQVIKYIPIYHDTLQPNSPPIKSSYVDPPTTKRVGLSKPVADFLLRLALGLVAGIVVAYLFEYLDDTVQDEADVQRWLGAPTLAVIPGGRQARRARSA